MARFGIVAGGGALPAMLADACRSTGQAYFIIALEDHADPERLGSHPHGWVRLGAGGRMVELARRERVTRIVFAGHVARPSLRALRPDLYTARILARIGLKALGDDRLMRHVVGAAEAEGFEVVGVDAILAEALAPTGTVTRLAPDETARADIGRGIEVARALGRADCGQSVVVQQGIVLALEAVEGTDAAMVRAGTLSRKGPGGVLVKVSKPGQDRRMDLPAVGPRTVAAAVAAGLRGIAVEAGATILLDRDELVRRADDAGLFVTGVSGDKGD